VFDILMGFKKCRCHAVSVESCRRKVMKKTHIVMKV